MDDLAERLDLVIAAVESARAMPLSDSCLLNRTELLAALEDLRARLPERLEAADRILAERDAVIADAYQRAAAIVAEGSREGARLASSSAVVMQAESDAAAIMAAARQASDEMRRQADAYVDGKLADFEDLLARTLASVTRGRERLASRGAVARGASQARTAESGVSRMAGGAVRDPRDPRGVRGVPDQRSHRGPQADRNGRGGGPETREPVSGHVRVRSGSGSGTGSGFGASPNAYPEAGTAGMSTPSALTTSSAPPVPSASPLPPASSARDGEPDPAAGTAVSTGAGAAAPIG